MYMRTSIDECVFIYKCVFCLIYFTEYARTSDILHRKSIAIIKRNARQNGIREDYSARGYSTCTCYIVKY